MQNLSFVALLIVGYADEIQKEIRLTIRMGVSIRIRISKKKRIGIGMGSGITIAKRKTIRIRTHSRCEQETRTGDRIDRHCMGMVDLGSPTMVSMSRPRAWTSTDTFPRDCREGGARREGEVRGHAP